MNAKFGHVSFNVRNGGNEEDYRLQRHFWQFRVWLTETAMIHCLQS
jgi:hypothetical protein